MPKSHISYVQNAEHRDRKAQELRSKIRTFVVHRNRSSNTIHLGFDVFHFRQKDLQTLPILIKNVLKTDEVKMFNDRKSSI